MNPADWTFAGSNRTDSGAADGPFPALLLGREATAQALGISERTLWTLTRSGEIPHVRVGHRVLYALDDLQTLVQGLKRAP